MAICFLCGKDGADTTEHVVPRCLYSGKLPSDVITLPAHGACNRLSSKDEEAFRNHVSVAIPPESPGHGLWSKTWTAIHRPEAAGMQRVFYRDMVSVPELDADGVLRQRPVAARLQNERANRVLAKIVKGLFAWRTKELLPNDEIEWRFGQAENGWDQVPVPNEFRVHDVLFVRWGRASDEPLATMWILGFYDVVWFWVSSMPAGARVPSDRTPGVRMAWP